MRYHANGKQVLRDGSHFADCIDSGGAKLIAESLNDRRTMQQSQQILPLDGADGPLFADAPSGVTYGGAWGSVRGCAYPSIRQENDEYACSCGKRWDVAEGENHP